MLLRLFALAAAAGAATIKIQVGRGGLTYTPDSVTAVVGDILEFQFVGGTHDVVSGDYARPCQPSPTEGGFASSVVQGSPNNQNVFKVTVNTTDPTYYYCSVGMHCANGMVAAVNPAADKTLASYKAGARGKSASRPTGVFGGVFGTPAPAA